MISCSFGHRAEFLLVFREARRTIPMTADRFTLYCRAILFLFVTLGLPSFVRPATLEDSAKAFARKIAAALPARENVSCEIRNISSLQPAEVARIEQALRAELQDRDIRLSENSDASINLVITLSENFANLVWTGEIHHGENSSVVLVAVDRSSESRALPSAMPVTIRSEKFWEGPEHILDAGDISDGAGKSWLVLLLPNGLLIHDKQSGSDRMTEVISNQSVSRDPWGNLKFEPNENTVAFFLSPRVCAVNLEKSDLDGCLPPGGSSGEPLANRVPVMFDVAPPGPPPQGKGTVIQMGPVCGSAAEQFLATSARDYTQSDSLQAFRIESGSAIAVSAELDFPGPITALHAGADPPRAVVRNLTTGNYEAYRLSFSCGQ